MHKYKNKNITYNLQNYTEAYKHTTIYTMIKMEPKEYERM